MFAEPYLSRELGVRLACRRRGNIDTWFSHYQPNEETHQLSIQTPTRSRSSRLLAIATSLLVVFSGLFVAPATAQADDVRQISVSTEEIAGEKVLVNVSGTGFTGIPLLPGQQFDGLGPRLYIAIAEKGIDLSAFSQDGSLNASVYPGDAGVFSHTFEQPAAGLDPTKSYEIIAWPSRSMPTEENLYTRADINIDWDALFPAPVYEPILTVEPATGLDPAGDVVTVTGSGYNPEIPIYVIYCRDTEMGDDPFNTLAMGCRTGAKQVSAFGEGGTFTVDLEVAAIEGGTAVYTLANHRNPANRTQDAKFVLQFADPEVPAVTTETALTTSAERVQEGEEVVFTAAVSPANATGTVTFQEGTTILGTVPVVDGSAVLTTSTLTVGQHLVVAAFEPSEGSPFTASVSGLATLTVTAKAPNPEPGDGPSVTLSPAEPLNPNVANVITVNGVGFEGPSAVNGVYVLLGPASTWAGQGPLPFEGWDALAHVPAAKIVDGSFSLDLSVAAGTLDPKIAYNVVTSAAHALALTDRSLDTFTPVSVATPEILVSGSPVQGKAVTFTGTGFVPGETVTATVYSKPIVIGQKAADARGDVSFDWTIPQDFAAEQHRIELAAASQTLNATFTVQAPAVTPVPQDPPVVTAPQVEQCTANSVSGASLAWGVKDSFVRYINGSIAKGQVSGAWGAGSGQFSTQSQRGLVNYGGGMHFTGHNGQLDLSISNPSILVTGPGAATLYATVSSKGYNGNPGVSNQRIAFANLSFSGAVASGQPVTAGATLTQQGAQAFAGFYQPGEALDSVTFTFPLGGLVECDDSTDPKAAAGAAAGLAATGSESSPMNAGFLGMGMLLLGALALGARRRLGATRA